MSFYQIVQTDSGQVMGVFEGDDEESAIEAMDREAGYASSEAAEAVAPRGGLVARRIDYRLTTDHAASSYGQPVLIDEAHHAYGPADLIPGTGEAAAAAVRLTRHTPKLVLW